MRGVQVERGASFSPDAPGPRRLGKDISGPTYRQRKGLGQIDVRIHWPIAVAQLEVQVWPGRVPC